MSNEGNLVISHIRAQMKSAHWLLEETISDVSDEMGRFALPGKALPIGAAYVHYVTGEDWMIHRNVSTTLRHSRSEFNVQFIGRSVSGLGFVDPDLGG